MSAASYVTTGASRGIWPVVLNRGVPSIHDLLPAMQCSRRCWEKEGAVPHVCPHLPDLRGNQERQASSSRAVESKANNRKAGEVPWATGGPDNDSTVSMERDQTGVSTCTFFDFCLTPKYGI